MNTPTVLITGALTGIGRATALAFAHEGARVVVSGRHDDEGQKLATELRKLLMKTQAYRTSITHNGSCERLCTFLHSLRPDGDYGNPACRAEEKGHRRHARSLWFLADVIRLFSNNVGPFSLNLVPKQRMFLGQAIYVLGPPHLRNVSRSASSQSRNRD